MLSTRDIAFIGCRLLALYVVVNSLQVIVFNTWSLLQIFRSQQQWSLKDRVLEAGFYIVPIIALLIMVAILWWRADWIAGKVAAPAADPPPTPKGVWSVQNALSVAVVAVGLWVVIMQVATLVQYIMHIFNSAPEGAGASARYWTNLVSALLTTALGLLCIFYSRPLGNTIARLRGWSAVSEK